MSQQLVGVYVKIVTDAFRPMNLPVGYVFSCTQNMAQYIVNNGDGVYCDSAGTVIVPTWPPKVQGIIANGTGVLIDYDIKMLVTDSTGLTVMVDDVEATISLISASNTNIDIVLSAAITAGQIVKVTYNAGNITSDATAPSSAPNFNDVLATNVTA